MTESGSEKELSVFIASVLKNVVEGVLMAQGAGVPAGLPDGVEFVFAFDNGEVEFVVPMSNMVFDRGQVVTYTHGSNTKN